MPMATISSQEEENLSSEANQEEPDQVNQVTLPDIKIMTPLDYKRKPVTTRNVQSKSHSVDT